MPQLERVPQTFGEVPNGQATSTTITLRSNELESVVEFAFTAVRPNVFHVTFTSESHPLPPSPSVETPAIDLNGASVEVVSPTSTSRRFTINDVVASVEYSSSPQITLSYTDQSQPLHVDLQDRSYVLDGQGVAHYTQHDRDALHVGLGEKRAPMDLTGRHFQISASDCFGYEVYHTDPMYKHMPWLIKATARGCVGILSTSHARGTWSIGSEIDGLWGHFKVYRQDYGGLEEFLIIGRSLSDVVKTYAELAGFPLLAPRWAYGYIAGGYKYAMSDHPPADQTILDFAERMRQEDIPCSGFQISSGWSISATEPKVRNVFCWNTHRFADPMRWALECKERYGMRLLINVKPFLLQSHPAYILLRQADGLFWDPHHEREGLMKLWSAGGGESGEGAHVDFTCQFAFDWWAQNVQKLKALGIDAIWNDNNEYTIPNDEWVVHNSTDGHKRQKRVGLYGRALQTEMMGSASYQGLSDAAPTERPFVLTRSASIGTLRYCAGSWSGDNQTSWEGMKGANSLSLNAGMSLMHCYGHDIGGFEGPQPSPELLLRWVQLGVYQPRFAINCFKTNPQDNARGDVIEPWMYPNITPAIRVAIKRRYELMPYIYSLAIAGHLTAVPPMRWIGWGHETDPEVWTKFLKQGEEQYWFGDALLIGGVYQAGLSTARMYLPHKSGEDPSFGFVNLNAPYQRFDPGQWVTIESDWRSSIPVLARIGSAIPIGRNDQTREMAATESFGRLLLHDDYRGIEIFPPEPSSRALTFTTTWYEDDGLSRDAPISSFTITYSATGVVTVGYASGRDNVFVPLWKELVIILPQGDHRRVVSRNDDARVRPMDRGQDGRCRFVLEIKHHSNH